MPDAATRARPMRRRRPPIASGADQAGVRLYNERLLALAGAALRAAVQDRGRAHDRPFGPVDFGDHEPAAGRRAAEARGAVARPRRPTDRPVSLDPEGAFSLGLKIGRRSCDLVLVDFGGARAPARRIDLRLSDARNRARFRRRALPPLVSRADAGSRPRHRRARRRGAVPALELGGRDRRAAGRDGRLAHRSRSRGDRRALPLSASRSAMTRPRPARRSSSSARPGASATSCISSSARFVGGGLVLDGALYPGRTGNAAARRLDADRRAGPRRRLSQLIPAPRSTSSSGASSGRARPLLDLAHAGRLGRFRRRCRRLDRRGRARARLRLVSAISVIDVAAIVIDGAMPAPCARALRPRRGASSRSSTGAACPTCASSPARSAPTRAPSAGRRCR